MFRTFNTTSTSNVRRYDTSQDQIRNEINTLRHNMHDLCTRTSTNFDCNKFLTSDTGDKMVIANSGSVGVPVEFVNTNKINSDRLLVESVPLRETRLNRNKYGECVVQQ
ncbi:hypothetical protein [Parapoynx stagnalis nucleopolyhedrovirus]|uniref:Uncharacterized protein n=1 Tax=Parapoynx stagnalis nucleopolyhedrovirus TaxID=2993413 RepID=A0A9E7Y757_9ABAC|nr:hypothetical protein [Parapoynx stagnalis nucleopolyhedrovirus]